ncbi:MFS transporter [Tessaracoccus sp. MC1865]|uniref:MFS transporter n=1 Tax=Tessaracoccus sp. MC1865 TaxID=2760310 RepID=UPI001603042C|nr:MFS transporter [Tessaracoccus sp. MC1865]MBB1482463.1 MFS transporter [Tessaracoccus sp. MC1865]QTO38081.1 MFS transporter [Tessaracoccus sp. MC1865]
MSIGTEEFGTTREALRIPAYRKLVAAWSIGNLGDSALFLTIGIWVKVLTGSDVFAATVFIVLGVPALFAPALGLLADTFSRKRILVISNIVIALAVLSLLPVTDATHLWLIYAVTFVYSLATYVNAAAQGGLLRDTLPDHLLAAANGLFGSIDQGLRIIAPLAAAGAFALWGIRPVLVVTAVAFLTYALLLANLRITETRNEISSEKHWFHTSLEGFGALHSRPRLWRFTLALAMAVFAAGAINALIFPILDTGLGLRAEMLSVFISVQGVFAVVSGLNAARLLKKWGYDRLMMVGLTLFVASFAALTVQHVVVLVFAIALLGMSMPLMIVATVTLRQLELPLNLQGRSGAAMNMMFNVPQVLTSAVVAALIGVVAYPWLIGAATVVATLGFIPLAQQARLSRRAAAELPTAAAPTAVGRQPADYPSA